LEGGIDMPEPTTILVGALLLGETAGFIQSYKTAKATKKAAAHATAAQAASNAENEKRMAEEQMRKESLARARAAASGLTGASVDVYLGALEQSNQEELDWLKQVGQTKVQATQMEGDLAYSQAMSNVFGSISSMASTGIKLLK